MRLGTCDGENRTGEVDEKYLILFAAGGEDEVGDGDCKSSKNDLFPQTMADIVQSD